MATRKCWTILLTKWLTRSVNFLLEQSAAATDSAGEHWCLTWKEATWSPVQSASPLHLSSFNHFALFIFTHNMRHNWKYGSRWGGDTGVGGSASDRCSLMIIADTERGKEGGGGRAWKRRRGRQLDLLWLHPLYLTRGPQHFTIVLPLQRWHLLSDSVGPWTEFKGRKNK